MDIWYMYHASVNWKDYMPGKIHKEVLACGLGWNQPTVLPAISQGTAHLVITSNYIWEQNGRKELVRLKADFPQLALQFKPGPQA